MGAAGLPLTGVPMLQNYAGMPKLEMLGVTGRQNWLPWHPGFMYTLQAAPSFCSHLFILLGNRGKKM